MNSPKPQIFVFIGPPYAGKDTQSNLLREELGLPVFSMGQLIRDAKESGDKEVIEAYEEYSMKGRHLPNSVKFPLLQAKMDGNLSSGFMLDNFPATQEDLTIFNKYLASRDLVVGCVFHIFVDEEEMLSRMKKAGRSRPDDTVEVVLERRRYQDRDRQSVLEFFRKQGLLVEINGEKSIGDIHKEIESAIESCGRRHVESEN